MTKQWALSVAMAVLVAACNTSGTATTVTALLPPIDPLGPFDPSAVIDSSVMYMEPSQVAAGGLASIYFPLESLRGVHFVLESWDGDAWNEEYHLVSDWGDGSHLPTTRRAGPYLEGFGVPDIGIGGPGPDVVLIPPPLPPGEYRICTGNARPNVCARLTIEAPA